MSDKYLVIIETSGNQAAIFGTNRLRENAGNSELTYRVGRQFVLEAVSSALPETNGAMSVLKDAACRTSVACFREKLLASAIQPGIEIVVCTSGKSILLVDDPIVARTIIQETSRRTLLQAPGIEMCGVVYKVDAVQKPDEAMRAAHRKLAELQSQRSGWNQRFPMIPIAAVCNSSGRPAAHVVVETKRGARDLSLSSCIAQRDDLTKAWSDRINAILEPVRSADDNISIPSSVTDLDDMTEECNWLAVVHADGNGLGEIFTSFEKCIDNTAAYFEQLRRFSCALEDVTERSFGEAVRQMKVSEVRTEVNGKVHYRRIVPLILGGDDLTVVMDGQQALSFTITFLQAFEKYSSENNDIADKCERMFGVKCLAASAGIAIVKHHFPFHHAYDLAASLIGVAKTVKEHVKHSERDSLYPLSTLDFHILFDSSYTELDEIRDQLTVDDGKTALLSRPYVVSDLEVLPSEIPKEAQTWIRHHAWFDKYADNQRGLESVVEALRQPQDDSDDRRMLSSSQVHDLRSAVFLGKGLANSRFQQVVSRHPGFKALSEDSNNLELFRAASHGSAKDDCRLLDAMDAAAFWNAE